MTEAVRATGGELQSTGEELEALSGRLYARIEQTKELYGEKMQAELNKAKRVKKEALTASAVSVVQVGKAHRRLNEYFLGKYGEVLDLVKEVGRSYSRFRAMRRANRRILTCRAMPSTPSSSTSSS